jgi:hypothetical protein
MIHRERGALDLAREIMVNESILKVGFGLDNDVRKLPPVLGVPLRNVFDFDTRFAKVGYGKNLGVRGAIAVVFNQDLRKSKKLTLANWAADQYKPQRLAPQSQRVTSPVGVPALPLTAYLGSCGQQESDAFSRPINRHPPPFHPSWPPSPAPPPCHGR